MSDWRESELAKRLDLIEDEVSIGGTRLVLLRPLDAAALVDEDDFAENEFLPYWADIWPAGLRLAEALPADLHHQRLVELGCGLGLPSLMAAARGGEVLATDWSTDAMALLAVNAARNDLELRVQRVDWSEPGALLAEGAFDLVLAADVLYEARNAEWLLELLPRLSATVLLADPGREVAKGFLVRAAAHFGIEDLGAGVSRLNAPRR
jgi:predicted nicotinamide N-methyase